MPNFLIVYVPFVVQLKSKKTQAKVAKRRRRRRDEERQLSPDLATASRRSRRKRQEPVKMLEETKNSLTSIDLSDHEVLVGCGEGRVRRYDQRSAKSAVSLMKLQFLL
jgi:hypothetical protein